MRTRLLRAAILMLCLWLSIGAPDRAQAMEVPAWTVPSADAIGTLLDERIEGERQGVGIVVGIIDADGRRIVARGRRREDDPRPPDGDTLFEIGSVTKVFTALLLAEMAETHEVALDDPVAEYLPVGVTMPERGGRGITLRDLATHMSGLPRLPANMAPADPANPYADYTMAQLHAFLGSYVLTRDIGSHYEYSNLGAGLLGDVLARRAGQPYEALVRTRITGPLGMASTAIALTPDMRARLASGYDASLQPASYWDMPTLAGAGALRSTANDLLRFLAAELGYAESPLRTAMAAQLVPREPTGMTGVDVALGWHITSNPTRQIVWHNGGTGGFRSFIGFDPAARLGVVVLTNAATERGGDDIGMHLLTGAPLQPPPVEATASLPRTR